jgi:uncharacterized membrane protein YgaE (UPF0421/DUF939 family)
MSAWMTILMMVTGVVISILFNLYFTSMVIDSWHETSVRPMQEEIYELRAELQELHHLREEG